MTSQISVVALRKESVDRNPLWPRHGGVPLAVALRKESVDRNLGDAVVHSGHAVALRKESVDRNCTMQYMQQSMARRSPQGERG